MGRINWTSEKIFDRLLNNKSTTTYWENIAELQKRGTESIYEQAVQLTNSTIDKEKEIGINVLAQLGFPRIHQQEIVDLFFHLLKQEQSNKVIFSILSGIGHNNENLSKEQIKELVKFKTAESNDVRYALVFALGGIDNTLAIETLIELTEDKYSPIRNWATFGIGSLSDRNNAKIRAALWKRTKDKHQETKYEAIVGLANRNEKAIKEQIITELQTGEFGTLLLDAIEALNDKDFIPHLETTLKVAQSEEETNQEWITAIEQCLQNLKEEVEHG